MQKKYTVPIVPATKLIIFTNFKKMLGTFLYSALLFSLVYCKKNIGTGTITIMLIYQYEYTVFYYFLSLKMENMTQACSKIIYNKFSKLV